MADVIEQAVFREETFDQGLHTARRGRLDVRAVNRLPGREPFQVARVHSMQGGHAIGDDAERVEIEQLGNIERIVLNLIVCALDGGVFVIWVLEFKGAEGQAGAVHDEVGAAVVRAVNGELAHDAKVVLGGFVPVDEVDVLEAFLTYPPGLLLPSAVLQGSST